MKTTISISIDVELALQLRTQGLSPSPICNEALWKAVGNPKLLDEKEKDLDKQIQQLNSLKTEFKIASDKEREEKDKKLQEFLSTSSKVLDNEIAMNYWSSELGRSVEELTRLRREQ